MAGLFDNDPLLGGYQQEHSRLIEEYRRKAEMQGSRTPLWDKIDAEIAPLTEEQKKAVFADEEYVAIQAELGQMVQEQILRIVKPQIEGTEKGRELLGKVYDIAVVAKKKAIAETSKEMELFKRWQAYSVAHPEATYAEFINATKKVKK
jgi:hypothetical protein